jgi:hypothetical protein
MAGPPFLSPRRPDSGPLQYAVASSQMDAQCILETGGGRIKHQLP